MTAAIVPPQGPPRDLKPVDSVLERSEDLTSDSDSEEEADEMGSLSDAPSSRTSLSRPMTPPNPKTTAGGRHIALRAASSRSASPDHFSLAAKAERILGLTPGTLPHARACLDNARDQVRRTGTEGSPIPTDSFLDLQSHSDSEDKAGRAGMKGKLDRAKKAMSVVVLPTGHARLPSVVIGTGGKEEEEKRERRRRAVDGVLYWQKEVQRLEAEAARATETSRRKKC